MQGTIKSILDACKAPNLSRSSISHSHPENIPMQTPRERITETRTTHMPELHSNSSYHEVPGSANIDVTGLSSPWPNLWSPSPADDSTDKVHEE